MATKCFLLLLALGRSGVALRFVTSPSRPAALYTAPAPYSASGRAPLSSVIITSAPLTVFNATVATPLHWRRHDAPENVAVSAAEPGKPTSQELLDAFMKEYAASVKNPTKPLAPGDRNNDRDLLRQPSPANRLASLSLDADADADAEIVATPVDVDENEASWDLVAAEKHNHPYDDREGWVTLEPVPWSASKVSKWHSQHPNGNKYPSSQPQSWLNSKPSTSYDQPKPHRPTWERPPSYWDNDKPSKPWDNDKPSKPWDNDKPSKPWDNDKPNNPWDEDKPKPWGPKPHDDSPYKPWHSDRPSKPSNWDERPTKPSWENDRPSKPTSWNDKPNKPSSWENGPSKPSWESDRPVKPSSWDDKPSKPSWESDRPSKPSSWDTDRPKPYDRPSKPSWAQGSRPSSDQSHQASSHRPSSWASHHADIITDESSEPWPADGHHRPQSSYDGNKHHSHSPPNRPAPGEGPGEWVLLSTTKGYSLPSRQRKGQRSLTVAPLTATRSVRLTVLPALNGSTTSHGGMIEVEKTTLTVDEAQEEDRKSRLLAVRPALSESSNAASVQESAVAPLVVSDAVVVTDDANVTAAAIQPVRRMQLNRRNAMLAAVGAGMVPATMALLVPMMMGRKKRSVDSGRFRKRVQLRHM